MPASHYGLNYLPASDFPLGWLALAIASSLDEQSVGLDRCFSLGARHPGERVYAPLLKAAQGVKGSSSCLSRSVTLLRI